jgi:hypothetical protein
MRAVWASSTLVITLLAGTCRADDGVQGAMPGALGTYGMTREASGTSWQPEAVPMAGVMQMGDDWMTMVHGYVDQVHDHQGGPRGGTKDFTESMLMLMAQRPWADGTLALHGMFSLDPFMGKDGYPLLLQTGETADGVHPLVDRQHPHDLLMELSASYSHPLAAEGSLFVYAGLPGEPALGPPAFMHRASGMDDPEAPLSHHWMDSTHVTYGVLTTGVVMGDIKLEASAFHGREPDELRWNIETGPLDSASARISWNPGAHWSLQASWGYLRSPEQLQPSVDQHRSSLSAMYGTSLGGASRWDTTLAWGRDDNDPGHRLDAWLLESEVVVAERHTFFLRAEHVREDELFGPGSPLEGKIVGVGGLSLGYIHDWPVGKHLAFGLGGLVSAYELPTQVQVSYGTPHSFMLFARLKVR